MNGKKILNSIDLLSLFLLKTGSYQNHGYNFIINKLKDNNLRDDE